MKARNLSAILVSGMLMLGTSAFAQQGQGKMGQEKGWRQGETTCMGIPNLSADQQTKIDALKLTHQKEMLVLKNQMGELKAKQRTLTTTDKADIKAINANIDEITKVKNQMMKKQAQHRQDVRALLNDEQKIWFDTHAGKRGGHKGMGMNRGDGKGKGMRDGNGRSAQCINAPAAQ
ncbi:MAG: periplasmic heavy metal sensor [Marinilabiliaceae bacterium]|nr:periplasmic heavy metal sensor [Marinilabiliaceae bacterium]